MQQARPTARQTLLAATALACIVGAVFWPILRFSFVDLDVQKQVVDNPYIRGLTAENLKHIFTSPCISSYYTLRTLTFAIDYQLWGLHAGGFKLTNALLHLGNVLLVFWLILRLFRHPRAPKSKGDRWEVAAATLGAGVFAVHPVVVEPVAWVAGREELLMTLGALGTIHCYITARRLSEKGGRTPTALVAYAGAVFCCAAACLSSAVAAVTAVLITAWDVLFLARPTLGKILRGTGLLWALGIATVAVKEVCEALNDSVAAEPLLSAARPMLILKVYWLNLRSLAWPTGLAVSHDWSMPGSFFERDVLLGAAAVVLTGIVFWKLRRRSLILFGLVWFGLALGPSSQIMPHHIDRADRFLYLPLVGLVVAVASALRSLAAALPGRLMAGAAVVGASVVMALVEAFGRLARPGRPRWPPSRAADRGVRAEISHLAGFRANCIGLVPPRRSEDLARGQCGPRELPRAFGRRHVGPLARAGPRLRRRPAVCRGRDGRDSAFAGRAPGDAGGP